MTGIYVLVIVGMHLEQAKIPKNLCSHKSSITVTQQSFHTVFTKLQTLLKGQVDSPVIIQSRLMKLLLFQEKLCLLLGQQMLKALLFNFQLHFLKHKLLPSII